MRDEGMRRMAGCHSDGLVGCCSWPLVGVARVGVALGKRASRCCRVALALPCPPCFPTVCLGICDRLESWSPRDTWDAQVTMQSNGSSASAASPDPPPPPPPLGTHRPLAHYIPFFLSLLSLSSTLLLLRANFCQSLAPRFKAFGKTF